ncbi:MAG: hypothetical protein WC307_03080 [Candidatus Nanoarchaeia archaeon]|jgi:ABC-type branched-subunit amino acid transport system substrate-binding protein
MVNITLSIPDELYERMKQKKSYRWSQIAAKAFENTLNKAELTEEIMEAINTQDKARLDQLVDKAMNDNPIARQDSVKKALKQEKESK